MYSPDSMWEIQADLTAFKFTQPAIKSSPFLLPSGSILCPWYKQVTPLCSPCPHSVCPGIGNHCTEEKRKPDVSLLLVFFCDLQQDMHLASLGMETHPFPELLGDLRKKTSLKVLNIPCEVTVYTQPSN